MSAFSRNIPLLAACQALMMSANAMLVTTSALVGYALATNNAYATLPYALQLVATMLTSVPAALIMKKTGRRLGFMLATLLGMAGGGLCSYAILHLRFDLFALGGFMLGMFNGFGNYYRFTAADSVAPELKSRAIAMVLAGGVIAAIVGPNLANFTRDSIDHASFAGSYAAIILIYMLSLLISSFLKLPKPLIGEKAGHTSGRPLFQIVSQPRYLVAVICGMCGYGVMALIMTATPLAMQSHAYPFSDTSFVIEWHVLGMYVPSFFTGQLINRFGCLRIMLLGALAGLACVAINLGGTSITHFWLALSLLGISWNFLFIGATTMLTETYRAGENSRAQAINDFSVFSTVALASLSAGALHSRLGWAAVNLGAIAPLVITVLSLLWLKRRPNNLQPAQDANTLEQAMAGTE